MPRDDGLGFNEGEGVRPAAPQSVREDPEQPVRGSEAWPRRGALEDGELVTQCKGFEHQGPVGPQREEEAAEHKGKHGGHHASGRPEVQR